jgi:hypothetical protein
MVRDVIMYEEEVVKRLSNDDLVENMIKTPLILEGCKDSLPDPIQTLVDTQPSQVTV